VYISTVVVVVVVLLLLLPGLLRWCRLRAFGSILGAPVRAPCHAMPCRAPSAARSSHSRVQSHRSQPNCRCGARGNGLLRERSVRKPGRAVPTPSPEPAGAPLRQTAGLSHAIHPKFGARMPRRPLRLLEPFGCTPSAMPVGSSSSRVLLDRRQSSREPLLHRHWRSPNPPPCQPSQRVNGRATRTCSCCTSSASASFASAPWSSPSLALISSLLCLAPTQPADIYILPPQAIAAHLAQHPSASIVRTRFGTAVIPIQD
jgi:hypothetical protein